MFFSSLFGFLFVSYSWRTVASMCKPSSLHRISTDCGVAICCARVRAHFISLLALHFTSKIYKNRVYAFVYIIKLSNNDVIMKNEDRIVDNCVNNCRQHFYHSIKDNMVPTNFWNNNKAKYYFFLLKFKRLKIQIIRTDFVTNKSFYWTHIKSVLICE